MGAAATCASAGRVASFWAVPATSRCSPVIWAGITVDRGAETSGPATNRQRGAVDSWVITVAA